MKKLRVGIAGYGVVGKRRRDFLDQHPSFTTVAVCDQKFQTSGTFDDGLHYYSHYADLLKHADLDVLFVCVTNDIAAEVTMAGLKAGLHTFCEKPPGRDIEDIASVIRVERANPELRLMYGFNHRYHDSVQEALRLIHSQELGKLINIRGVYGKSQMLSFKSDWRTKRSIAGGGILLDQGIHMVDMMRLFAGEFSEIHSFVSNTYWNHDVEDNAYALMKTDKGVVGMLHSSATQWRHRFHLEMALEKGSITLSGILSGTKSYGAETISIAYKNEAGSGDPMEKTIRFVHDPSWEREIDEFYQSILKGRTPKSSSLDALLTMLTVYRIYCADSKWREKFDLSAELPADLFPENPLRTEPVALMDV
ncbi:MAG: Gfo/Idh/MocA family protein [Bdellovibrionales bacterium]